jgi:RNAse (barnase) inhibitor barstar
MLWDTVVTHVRLTEQLEWVHHAMCYEVQHTRVVRAAIATLDMDILKS